MNLHPWTWQKNLMDPFGTLGLLSSFTLAPLELEEADGVRFLLILLEMLDSKSEINFCIKFNSSFTF